MLTKTKISQPAFLKKKLFLGLSGGGWLAALLTVLACGFYLYNIRLIGDANTYYTAAVQSMLKSWSNFFFVAAEPGGSVSVDKPPLGLWIEAAFAYVLGVSGFSVTLPNILAGTFSVPLLYGMVKKYAGELAGLVAAFVLAFTPVFVATNRNNTMDGMLVFCLLLAAWAFIRATESGKLGWLLGATFIVGLGFNIKMMQAFLPLPAFYALYFFGAKENWIRKALNLVLATILLLSVSLAWAIAVDLTPANARPYVGSSENNTVMGLIFGHNGISRLENLRGDGGGNPPPSAPQPDSNPNPQIQPGPNQTYPVPPFNPNGGAGGTPFSQETGAPGILRFFTQPLSKQMSWLLPFALISVALALFAGKVRLPLESPIHKALILWGGWLLTCVVFFSAISGIFHSYYAIMLAPALGAMVGIGFALLWSWGLDTKWIGALFIAAGAVTLGFQIFAAVQYGEQSWWMLGIGLLFGLGSLLTVRWWRVGSSLVLLSMFIIPTYWSAMTVISNQNQGLPSAYAGSAPLRGEPNRMRRGPLENDSNLTEELTKYLEANTQGVEYLVAVPSSQQGSELVLATGRPVLYMGGFSGQDEVVSADDLAQMIQSGELKFVLMGGGPGRSQAQIEQWLKEACTLVPEFSGTTNAQGPRERQRNLYQCQ
ncbi:MAG: glycosyltransferase family 39 protein [Anaerolineales bacterium]|nr:glycosyltransferase family 39 protein [Anaerolineales bacterium]